MREQTIDEQFIGYHHGSCRIQSYLEGPCTCGLVDLISTLRAEQTRLREALKRVFELADGERRGALAAIRDEIRDVADAALSSTPTPETTP